MTDTTITPPVLRILPDTTNQPKVDDAKAKKQPKAATKAAQPKVVGPKLQPIPDGENAKRSFTIDEGKKTVLATYAFKLNESAKERYQKDTLFDFSQCTMTEILELAAATVRITTQRNLRAMGPGALNPDVYKTVNVKRDIIETQRQVADVDTKAVRALMAATGVSAERALAILESTKGSKA